VWTEICTWNICVKCICEFCIWKIITCQRVNGMWNVCVECICEFCMWKIIVCQRVNGNMYVKYMYEMYLREMYVENNCMWMCECGFALLRSLVCANVCSIYSLVQIYVKSIYINMCLWIVFWYLHQRLDCTYIYFG